MRNVTKPGAVVAAALLLATGTAADAQQRIVQNGPGAGYGVPGGVPGHAPVARPAPVRPGYNQPRPARWGSKVGGRWWGGANAPGGWAGYRRPVRGWAVPPYWIAPRFYITDWSSYGLSRPAPGYNWSRYYDDAVLIDSRGSVYDVADGVDWDSVDRQPYYGDGYYPADDRVYAGPAERGPHGVRRDDNGLGGAAIGAVAGGVAGNVIAGRGNRLGGTLIGAGVGAAAGYAIDKNEDRGRRGPPPPPPPPAAYAPGPGYGAPYPAPGYAHAPGGTWVSPDGGTTVTTTNGTAYYPGGSTTTIVVQSAPVVTTTTTTEYYEDRVTYSKPAPRRVWTKKRVWKAKPRCTCS